MGGSDISLLRQQAVQLAKQKKIQQSYTALVLLHSQHPSDLPVLYDLVEIAARAGKLEESFKYSQKIDNPETAPTYVLEYMGKVARGVRQYTLSERYYHILYQRQAKADYLLGSVLAKTLSGKFKQAQKSVRLLKKIFPESVEYYVAEGFWKTQQKSYSQAIGAYLKGLEKFPEHPELLSGLLQVYRRSNAFSRVQQLVQAHPNVFSADVVNQTEGDLLASRIRFDEASHLSHTTESQLQLKTISELEKRIKALRGKKGQREKFDLLVAYVHASFPRKAIALYRQLLADQVKVPNYAKAEIAKAYLDVRRPKETIAIYHQIYPQRIPFKAQQILFYAYVESRQFDKAEQLIATMRKENPTFLGKKVLRVPEKNQKRIEAELHHVELLAEKGELKKAYQSVHQLLQEAPANPQIREKKAIVSASRGWHETAGIDYKIATNFDANRLATIVHSIDNDMALGHYARARKKLALTSKLRPNSLKVRQLQKEWQRRNGWQLSGNIGYGDNKKSVFARNQIQHVTTLKGPRFNDKWRPYLSHVGTHAGTKNKTHAERTVAGIELESGKNLTKLALGTGDNGKLAADVNFSRRLNDYWHVNIGYNKNTTVPIRASRDDVDGDKVSAGLNYRADETFNAGVTGQLTNFSDGNRRFEIATEVKKQLYQTPNYKLTAGLHVDYARNRKITSASYFNPEQSGSATISLDNRWLTYANYDFRFSQNLLLETGITQQKHFGNDSITNIRYGHDWQFNKDLSLYYYVNWKSQVYDGKRENNTDYMIGFNWKMY